MGLRVHRHDDVDDFQETAEAFLAEREAEHNQIFGICSWVRASPELIGADPPTFMTVTDEDGRVVGASLRTPPYNQVLSEMDDPAAIDALADALLGDRLPGVIGPKEVAAGFAERWTAGTGQSARLVFEERIFRLVRVTPPARPAVGSWRLAEPRDRRLIADWLVSFTEEALPGEPSPPDPLESADRAIAGTHRWIYLWEADGEVVSLLGAGGATPNGIRIGPVYTPPALRGRGYASSLTAAASRDQLDRGRRFVFLFTDLANPTSNRIYQAIGYRPVRDVDFYRFGDGP